MTHASRVFRALGAVLAVAAMGIATLTACTSQPTSANPDANPNDNGMALISKKWGHTLGPQIYDTAMACKSATVTVDCYNHVQAIAAVLQQIRQMVPDSSAAASSQYSALIAALDTADQAIDKFNKQCLPGTGGDCIILRTNVTVAAGNVKTALS